MRRVFAQASWHIGVSKNGQMLVSLKNFGVGDCAAGLFKKATPLLQCLQARDARSDGGDTETASI
jgi:hypothetical protein